jgi:phosphoglycolate phosphatase-like HAD superfamily hydrolase
MNEKSNLKNYPDETMFNDWIIIMDLDGTLIDSDLENMKILNELLKDNGLEDKIELIFSGLAEGKEFNEIMAEINMRLETRKALEYQLFKKLETRETNLFPNVKNTLINLNKKGIKLSIVTNNYLSFTKKTLEEHKLIELFEEDLILCYDNFEYLKPSNIIVHELFARKKLGEIGKGIIIGNSLKDIEFARNSGLFMIYINGSLSKIASGNESVYNKREDVSKIMSYDKLYRVTNWIEVQNIIEMIMKESIKFEV